MQSCVGVRVSGLFSGFTLQKSTIIRTLGDAPLSESSVVPSQLDKNSPVLYGSYLDDCITYNKQHLLFLDFSIEN